MLRHVERGHSYHRATEPERRRGAYVRIHHSANSATVVDPPKRLERGDGFVPISECFVSSADHSVTGRCRHSVLAPRRRVPICRSPVRPSDADAAVGQSGLSLWDVEHGASPVAGLVETMYVPSSRRTRLPVGLRGTPDLLAVFRDVVAVSRTVTRTVTLQERQPTLASVSGIYQRFRGQWQTSTNNEEPDGGRSGI